MTDREHHGKDGNTVSSEAVAHLKWQERQHEREQANPPQLARRDGSVLVARMTRIDGRALTRFMIALAGGVPPEPDHTARVLRLWHEGALTPDEMDELWRLAASPEHPFSEHDRMPPWDVILSGFETARPRH